MSGGRLTDIECTVIAGAITHERLKDIEERLVARPDHPVGKVMRMGIAPLARNGVDGLHIVGAVGVEEFVDLGDNVVLANAGPKFLIDQVIGAVDHGGRAVEKRNLIGRLDLTGFQHDLLAVLHLEAGLSSSYIIGGSMMSTPIGMLATPAVRRIDAISSA